MIHVNADAGGAGRSILNRGQSLQPTPQRSILERWRRGETGMRRRERSSGCVLTSMSIGVVSRIRESCSAKVTFSWCLLHCSGVDLPSSGKWRRRNRGFTSDPYLVLPSCVSACISSLGASSTNDGTESALATASLINGSSLPDETELTFRRFRSVILCESPVLEKATKERSRGKYLAGNQRDRRGSVHLIHR